LVIGSASFEGTAHGHDRRRTRNGLAGAGLGGYHRPVSSPTADLVRAGREALERHAWPEAYAAFVEADVQGSLSGDELLLLSQAAWWAGEGDAVLEACERAYRAFLAADAPAAAAMAAFRLAEQYAVRQAMPVAQGWLTRAAELAAEHPEYPVTGYIATVFGEIAMEQGAPEDAVAQYDRALAAATATADRNLYAMALQEKGAALCVLGRSAEGMALMDEAMVAVVGGELDPFSTGRVYCQMIGTCMHLGEYGRASQWTEATTRWCERHAMTGFPGVCRVHKAELLRIHGEWPDAEREARRACDELPSFNMLWGVGLGSYEIGEVRRRMGDLAAAEESYARASEFGYEPEPGLSLLRLAQGKVDSAASRIRRALAEPKDSLNRVKLLLAQAEIALAAGDLQTAASSSAELDAILLDHEAAALQAAGARVRGAVRLAEGDPETALSELRTAWDGWQQTGAPYEVAEVRVLMGRAYRALGDDDAAETELKAARAAFERLGARQATTAVAGLLGDLAASGEPLERVRRAFMFTDIVKSTDLVSAMGDEAWETLLAWHDQTLRVLFASHGGEVAHHTGDGFFVAFADASSALTAAVAIQRALAEHRRAHGFAPSVRIGVHSAEATNRGGDYSGGEVHKAARIAAAAGAAEILASTETLDEASNGFPVSEPREIAAKGITEPVRVATVDWRPTGR
jgi:class 3 adenylate cyclase